MKHELNTKVFDHYYYCASIGEVMRQMYYEGFSIGQIALTLNFPADEVERLLNKSLH